MPLVPSASYSRGPLIAERELRRERSARAWQALQCWLLILGNYRQSQDALDDLAYEAHYGDDV